MFDALSLSGAQHALSVGSVVVSVISASISVRSARQQTKIRFDALRLQLDRLRIEWGGDVIGALAEAEVLAKHLQINGCHVADSDSLEFRRESIRVRLSSLADRGRMYFPNVYTDRVGLERNAAFRGHRPAILDAILLVHHLFERLEASERVLTDESLTLFVQGCRRVFVSELQTAIGRQRLSILVSHDAALTEPKVVDLRPRWTEVLPLVEQFEGWFGAGAFWKERPPIDGLPSSPARWQFWRRA